MKELVFQVTFLSDIVLPASSNTEGRIDQHDFIAGSNFLGMVATQYAQFQNSFDVFHSGKVRFGDATILHDGNPTYKMPLSIFKEKTDENKIINQITTSLDELKQAQQLRNGYITKECKLVHPDYSYSQKSAYDKEKRTSKEGQMYGYKSLKKGTIWQFAVKIDDISAEDEKLIIDTLESSSRLGRSKSAEYGQVKISYLADATIDNIANTSNGEVALYCNSRLALVDESGNPTYDLKFICDGLDASNINYDKTQIRTSTFTPYNGVRQTKDYERVCINKGSVIVLKDLTPKQLEQIKNGVGAYLSEGFGEIIINPSFLMTPNFTLKKEQKNENPKDKRVKITQTFTDDTVQFLVNRHNANIEMLDIANEVAEFIKTNKAIFSNIKRSQWGNIRSIASSGDVDFEAKIKAYIGSGTKKWETNQINALTNAINNHKINKRQFIQLLSMQIGAEK